MNLYHTSAASPADIHSSSEAQTSPKSPSGLEKPQPALTDRKADQRDFTSLRPRPMGPVRGSHMVANQALRTITQSTIPNASILNSDSQRQFKRKWEDDIKDTIQEESYTSNQEGDSQTREPIIGHDSSPYISNEGTEEPSKDWSSKKRIKPNEGSQGSISRTGHPFQSPILPAELWQHIFCFVPPVFLGRLIRVNRAFHAYLTPGKTNEQDSMSKYNVKVPYLGPEAIWAASRRRFCPGLPKPIRGVHELEMWRLLRGRDCQVCGEMKESNLSSSPENPWESGPGDNGIRVIWPFALRCCGTCIPKVSEKEVNLMFSDCPAFLIPALPFAFISSSNNYIPSTVLRGTTPPPSLKLTKHYYKPHVKDVMLRLENARELGNASTDEWIKGLDSEGKDRLNEAVRWEQWDAKGGLKKVNLRSHPKSATTQGSNFNGTKASNTKGGTPSDRSTPQGIRLSTICSADSGSPASASPVNFPYYHPPMSSSFQPTWAPSVSYPDSLPSRIPQSFTQPRPERNIRDVNEAKATRRAEIERRCAELDPPLLPNILSHMENFQAAIQISQPLTEQAWQVLKPRLLIQRAYAEMKEKDRLEQSQLLQAENKQRRQQEVQLKETKESLDRGWASIQMPIRLRIAKFADEIIQNSWAGGKSVTKENSPKFAADVLLYVRRRFYDEVCHEMEDGTSNGEISKNNQPDSASSRMLILENMKWLFDTKIKPLTEHFQKELFLCSGCDGNFKFYGLDSVVQHYAAKHTHNLSLGNQVVHWRAEWPKQPPFHPEPIIAKAAYHSKFPVPQHSAMQSISVRDSPIPLKHEVYAQLPKQAIHPAQTSYNGSQYSPIAYKESYSSAYQQDRKYSPPVTQTFPQSAPVAPHLPQDFQANPNYGPGYSAPPHNTYTNAMQANDFFQSSQSGGISPADRSMLPGFIYSDLHAQDHRPTTSWYGFDAGFRNPSSGQVQPNVQKRSFYPQYPEQGRSHIGPAGELYQQQIDEMAKHARDVWFATSGIKDLPQSVRIFVVIWHMVARFKKIYSNEPSLVMFIDGLDRNAHMRPVRSLNGLACKLCVTKGIRASGELDSYAPSSSGDRRLYTLPHLLNHFRTTHLENSALFGAQTNGLDGPNFDWKLDMIELPEKALIADLINATGLDVVKLDLIAQAFPGLFPSDLPGLAHSANTGPIMVYRGGFASGRRQPSKIASEPFTDSPSRLEVRNEKQKPESSYGSFREGSQPAQSSEPPGEDEYDPHKPALPSGVGLVHTQKTARTPSTDIGQQQALHRRNGTFQYSNPDAIDRPRSRFHDTLIRRVPVDHHLIQPYEPSSRARSRVSQHRVETQHEERFHDEPVRYSGQQPAELHNGHGTVVKLLTEPAQNSEDRDPEDGATSLEEIQPTSTLVEGANAADQFLDSLPLTPDPKPGKPQIVPLDREGTRSIVRRDEHSQDRYLTKEIDETSEPRSWRIDIANGQREEIDPSSLALRRDPLKGRDYDGIGSAQGRHSHQYEDNYSSWPHVHRRLSESRGVPRSAETYYELPPNTVIQSRYGVVEKVIEGSHIRDRPFQVSQAPRYRSRSRSPRPVPLGTTTTLYRARSPADDHRHESVFHLRSPASHKESHSQRIFSYDYPPQDRYEYVDERNIQYIPVRVRETAATEPSRFVISQPTDTRPPPAYVRYDRGFPAEPVYAERSSYPPQQGHGPGALPQGYRY